MLLLLFFSIPLGFIFVYKDDLDEVIGPWMKIIIFCETLVMMIIAILCSQTNNQDVIMDFVFILSEKIITTDFIFSDVFVTYFEQANKNMFILHSLQIVTFKQTTGII